MALVSRAIWLSVLSAVLTCAVVVLLFAGSLLKAEFGTTIALLFIATMIALGLGFAVFLLETRVASRAVRIRTELLEHQEEERE
jgi:methylthioribose-1-phosphate isomerase